jgi:Zn-dependent M28 family amino/carboxypeptidase
VGAHSDHVEEGAGAIDNWSGAALLSSLYQSLAQAQRRHTFVFIAFTAEEEGLIGSRFYVGHLTKQELSKVSAMLNMDSLGAGPTKVATSNTDQVLLSALATVANSIRVPLSAINFDKVGISDSGNFSERRVPIIDLHSLTQKTFPLLHTNQDRLSAVDFGAYYDSYRLIAAYLAYLDQILDATP